MNFKTKPFAHQLEQFNRHKDDEYFALFDGMGTGKSKIAIDIAVHKYETEQIDSILIIAPNNVHSQWVNEQFPTHCAIDYKALIWDSSKRTSDYFERQLEDLLLPKMNVLKVFSVNVEAFQSKSIIPYIAAYVKNNKVFTIVDEATRIKTPKAIRTKTIHKLEKYGHRCILTGTPTTKNPFSLWSMFEFLKSNYFGCNYFIFQAKYGIMMQGLNNRTGGRYKTLIDDKTWNIALSKLNHLKEMRGGTLMPDDYLQVSYETNLSENNLRFIEQQQVIKKYKNLNHLKEQVDPITSYAKKEDCLDLPEKIYEVVELTMDKEHKKVYTTLKKQLLAQYDGEELTVTNKIALTTRLMQICGGYFPYQVTIENDETGEIEVEAKAKMIGTKNLKIERLKEELEELEDFPIIIWARYINELKGIYNELKKDYNCALYYGGTPKGEREQIIQDFKANKYDIFIGNPMSAAFGLNFQNATTQFWFSNGYNVEERLQGEDRSHRLGVKKSCLYKDIIFKNTVDEKVLKAIKEGKDMNDFFRSNSLRDIIEN